jgi:hypothetical protein
MPLLNHLKIYRDDIRPLLDDGEEPFAMAAVSLANGARHLERTPEDVDRALRIAPRGVRDRAKAQARGEGKPEGRSFLDVVLGVLDPRWRWNSTDWDKALSGVAVAGHVDSTAYRLVRAIDGQQALYCVVTARRLLIVRQQGTKDFTVVFEAPRQSVVTARRKGRGYTRGRVIVEFADSSMVALHAGFVDAGRANDLVKALG